MWHCPAILRGNARLPCPDVRTSEWQGDGVSDESWRQRRTSFGRAAADYASGRPHYPREALQWGAADGATTALDLGAGTGIIAADLLDLGLEVIAIEPLEQMRALIPSGARVLDGSAEAIPLPDASVDAVFVGQAWHWFDAELALVEARRVLRPGGTLVLMWNLLDTDDQLSRAIADIIDADERSDMMLDGETAPPYEDDERFGRPERQLIRHTQDYDAVRVVEFALSRSQSILNEPTKRHAMVQQLCATVPEGRFPLHWICEAWRSTAI